MGSSPSSGTKTLLGEMKMEETQDKVPWWIGPIVALFIFIGIPVIILLIVTLFVDFKSPEEVRLERQLKCQEAFTEIGETVEGMRHFEDLICFSFEDDGSIKGRILENK